MEEGIKHWQYDKCGSYEVALREDGKLAESVHTARACKHEYDLLTP